MGQLRDRMEGDLLLKGVAEVTRAEYLRCARHLAAYYRRSPAALAGGPRDVGCASCVAPGSSQRTQPTSPTSLAGYCSSRGVTEIGSNVVMT